MSISAVTSAFAAHSQQVVSGTASVSSSANAATQEALETKATTIKEAQNGDPVAKRKLLKIQAQAEQQQQAEAAKPSEPGKGGAVDHIA